ncbi:MAG: DUF4271 domain-containing protein [Phocaeicola sp.]
MSESCYKDLANLFYLHEQSQIEIDSALLNQTENYTIQKEGFNPLPRPYLLRSDGAITCFLFFSYILLAYMFSYSKNYLLQEVRSFFVSKERTGSFYTFTASDARCRFALIFITTVLLGFTTYDYLLSRNPLLFSLYSHVYLLGALIGGFILFFLLKYLAFQLVNSVFFDKTKARMWINSYFNALVVIGFLLSPIVLLIIYFNLPANYTIYLSLFVVLISKILLFYKCRTTFFDKIHSSLHLILYFCALEIIPELLFWKAIILMNTSLVLNF